MYTIIDKLDRDYGKWKLSYIDDIPREIYKATPETEEYYKTQEYKDWKELHGYHRYNPRIEYKNYPNPEYIPGEREYYAYFSPVEEMGDVVSDDADDVPYEHNAGEPYDEVKGKEVEILKLPFSLPLSSFWRGEIDIEAKEPKDWSYQGNSPFSMEDINLGAVPWIFVRTYRYKYGNKGISFMAGITPEEFLKKIQEVKELVKKNLGETSFTPIGKLNDLWIIRNDKSYAIKGFNDRGKQQCILWKRDYYNSYNQVFETYEDELEVTLDNNQKCPDTLISEIKKNYL